MLSYCQHLQQLSVVAATDRISREVICEVTPVDDNDNQDNEMTVD